MFLFKDLSMFPTSYDAILRIAKINPVAYGTSINYIDGAVTYLPSYISRGAISTKQVLSSVLDRGYQSPQIEKFIQELAKNIKGIQGHMGKYSELLEEYNPSDSRFKEHPLK